MGAETFFNKVRGKFAKELFHDQVQSARYEYGNGGYTGTIAEKSGFTMSKKPRDIKANDWIDMVENFHEDDTDNPHYHKLKKDSDIFEDKWGDALCVPTNDGFIFCGYAKS